MKKFNLIIMVLIIYLGAISGIYFLFFNSLKSVILKKFDMQYKEFKDTEVQIAIQKNLQNIEENISKLLLETKDQNISLNNLNKDISSKDFPEVKELKDLLFVYIDNIEKYIAYKKQVASIETVEADFLIQTLLDRGFLKYNNKNFTEAIKIYKEVLNLDSKNAKAICYFSASLYYQNIGDSTHYSDIKNNLIPLLEADILFKEEEKTIINILKGIRLEEGE